MISLTKHHAMALTAIDAKAHLLVPLRFLICFAVVGATQPAIADQVNRCKDPNGRIYMTERPCGNPATERHNRRPAQISADEVDAKEIFNARSISRDGRPPASPDLIDSRGIPRFADEVPPGAVFDR